MGVQGPCGLGDIHLRGLDVTRQLCPRIDAIDDQIQAWYQTHPYTTPRNRYELRRRPRTTIRAIWRMDLPDRLEERFALTHPRYSDGDLN